MDLKTTVNFINSEFSGKEKALKLDRADELVSRGLTDEKIIIDIIKNEKCIPKRLPSELYDKMNYMCRRYMDRMAHFEIEYDFVPDIGALKNIIICMIESAPVFHSAFIDNHINTYWKVSDYHVDDIFSVKETDDFRRTADEFLIQTIDVRNNVQIKILLLTCNGHSKLCLVFNHMCIDGGGLKQFLSKMFKNYSEYVSGGSVSAFYDNASRAYEHVYDGLSNEEKKQAKRLFANVSTGDSHALALTESQPTDQKMFVRKRISRNVFENVRRRIKLHGATVNDLVSAAYIRAFYDVSGCSKNEKVGLSCAVDLRRYIKHPENLGYTNHTAFMPCSVDSMGETMADTLKAVIESTKKAKGDRFMGLHGIPMLNLGFSTMIYAQAEFITSLFYNVANLSVSNVGVIDPYMFAMDNRYPTEIWGVGAAKEKPCAAMCALSYNGDLMLSICIRGNEADRKLLEDFLDRFEENAKQL